jgi:hypothetical protein
LYELQLRKNRYDVYDIYKDNERVRDGKDLCVCINEERHSVAFYNAYTAHNLLDVDTMLDEIVGILMMIDDTKKWCVDSKYDFYQINKELEIKLNNI